MSTLRKSLLVVEVTEARNLVSRDRHGTSSPYAVLDFRGQRKRTRTVPGNLNPAWNETLEFNVRDVVPGADKLEVNVFHDRSVGPTIQNSFLGRVRLSSARFVKKGNEALIYYPLDKKGLLRSVKGEIGLKIYLDDGVAPPPSRAPPSEGANPSEAKMRVEAVVTWGDPHVAATLVGTCLTVAFVMYFVPLQMVVAAAGYCYLMHHIFRDNIMPAFNFFRRQ